MTFDWFVYSIYCNCVCVSMGLRSSERAIKSRGIRFNVRLAWIGNSSLASNGLSQSIFDNRLHRFTRKFMNFSLYPNRVCTVCKFNRNDFKIEWFFTLSLRSLSLSLQFVPFSRSCRRRVAMNFFFVRFLCVCRCLSYRTY